MHTTTSVCQNGPFWDDRSDYASIPNQVIYRPDNVYAMDQYVPGESEKKKKKKYGVADYQYFKNGKTQYCNIFRHDKYNFHLVVCEVSTPNVKCKRSYKRERNESSNGT